MGQLVLVSGACGNALHTPAEFAPLVGAVQPAHAVFHFWLDPSLEAVVRRVEARGGDKTEEWLATHVRWMRDRHAGWSRRIDNTELTPIETIAAIAERLAVGDGRLPIGFGEAQKDPSAWAP